MTDQESRILSMRAARHCFKNMNMSSEDFLSAVEIGAFDEEYLAALRAVRSRGELEHLVSWVWTFHRLNKADRRKISIRD